MNEEEKFDELLSSKLSEREFPFDELNWDEAERLIIQQEKRKRITRFGLIFSGGLAAGILIMLPFIINTHSALPANFVATTSSANQHNVVQNNVSIPATQSLVNTNNINAKEKAPLPVQSAFVKKDTRTGTRSKSSGITSITGTSKKHSSPLVARITKSRHRNKFTANADLVASVTTRNKKSIRAKNVNQKEATNILPSNNNAIAEKETVSNKPTSLTTGNSNPITANNGSSTNTTQPGKTIAANTAASNSKNISPPIKKDTTAAGLPPLLPGTEPPHTDNNDYVHNILSVYAGGNYSFGWNDEGSKEGSGTTPWAGFNFTHYFTPAISASFGIGYSGLTGLNKTYTGSMVQYDFGANSSITTVTPQKAYYIAFPLKLQYNFDNKNMFSVGLDYLLLLTTYSTLTTYQQTYFSRTAATSVKQNGYTQGFSNSDMQFTASYTRMLLSRLGISLEYYRDLNNIENNTIPGINQYAKNNGFRLILSYQLMK